MHLLEEKEKFTYLHAQTYSKPTNKTSPLLIHYLAGFPDKQQSPSLSFFPVLSTIPFAGILLRERQTAKIESKSQKGRRVLLFQFMHYALVLHTGLEKTPKSFPNPSPKIFFLIFNLCQTGILISCTSLHLKQINKLNGISKHFIFEHINRVFS